MKNKYRIDSAEQITGSVIGIDEANFSPSICGDCLVCALYYPNDLEQISGVRDSKKLTPKKRLELFKPITERAKYSVVPATVNQINNRGIYEARNDAMLTALEQLMRQIPWEGDRWTIVLDGYWSEAKCEFFECWLRDMFGMIPPKIVHLVRADDKVYEVSCASIVARIYADALFYGWGTFYPGYGMEHDHGTVSKSHKRALRAMGTTPVHRTEGYAKNWWDQVLHKPL